MSRHPGMRYVFTMRVVLAIAHIADGDVRDPVVTITPVREMRIVLADPSPVSCRFSRRCERNRKSCTVCVIFVKRICSFFASLNSGNTFPVIRSVSTLSVTVLLCRTYSMRAMSANNLLSVSQGKVLPPRARVWRASAMPETDPLKKPPVEAAQPIQQYCPPRLR